MKEIVKNLKDVYEFNKVIKEISNYVAANNINLSDKIDYSKILDIYSYIKFSKIKKDNIINIDDSGKHYLINLYLLNEYGSNGVSDLNNVNFEYNNGTIIFNIHINQELNLVKRIDVDYFLSKCNLDLYGHKCLRLDYGQYFELIDSIVENYITFNKQCDFLIDSLTDILRYLSDNKYVPICNFGHNTYVSEIGVKCLQSINNLTTKYYIEDNNCSFNINHIKNDLYKISYYIENVCVYAMLYDKKNIISCLDLNTKLKLSNFK